MLSLRLSDFESTAVLWKRIYQLKLDFSFCFIDFNFEFKAIGGVPPIWLRRGAMIISNVIGIVTDAIAFQPRKPRGNKLSWLIDDAAIATDVVD